MVYSSQVVSGEIKGYYQFVNGSINFKEPPAASAIAPLDRDAIDCDIVRFLNQATFAALAQTR